VPRLIAPQYLCARCGTKVDAIKRMSLHTLPRLLTVQLKRFSVGGLQLGAGAGGGGRKIRKHIKFDTVLDLADYTSATLDKPHASAPTGAQVRRPLRLFWRPF
jgi:uncharacterized UBP type Zn finger protein